MVITEVTSEDVVMVSRAALGLSTVAGSTIDEPFLAASLRRTAGFLCPCSPSTLIGAVADSLRHLADDPEVLSERLEAVAEKLIVIGDLLELNQVTLDNSAARGTWVFAAPPSFVPRSNQSTLIIGLAKDQSEPLPQTIRARIDYHGSLRVIRQRDDELLRTLRDLGVLETSEAAWLKSPKPQSARDFRDDIWRKLNAQLPSGSIEELTILDPARPPSYYKGRWATPKDESGIFVCRRPQAYGAPLWGVVALSRGQPARILDLPPRGSPLRGCDVAWHLQMAVDHLNGTPQLYRLRKTNHGACIDLFSPLPLWAQRRLSVLGREIQPEHCLMSFLVPDSELANEEQFLKERLWLSPRPASG